MEWWQAIITAYVMITIILPLTYWVSAEKLCCSAHWHNNLEGFKELNIFGEILFTLLAIIIIPLDFIVSLMWEIIKLGIKK